MRKSYLWWYYNGEGMEQNKYNERWGMTFVYDENSDILYARTDIGCWKIVWDDKPRGFRLYHMNIYSGVVSIQTLLEGEYHRQHDMRVTNKIESILVYIRKHDLAKKRRKKDYRYLPKNTKCQKRRYNKARQKHQFQQINRVDEIFKVLEENNPSLLLHQNTNMAVCDCGPLYRSLPEYSRGL